MDALIGRLTRSIMQESRTRGVSPYVVATTRARERVLAARGKPRRRFEETREEIRRMFADVVASGA
jgi:hypothetical protein